MRRSPREAIRSISLQSLARSRVAWILAALAVCLLVVRLILPTFVARYVNRKLNEIPGYRGHVADVRLHLWRGAYTIDDARLEERGHGAPVRAITARRIDLSVDWSALFHGAAVGRVTFLRPNVTIVEEASKPGREKEKEAGQSATDKIRELFPLRIDGLTVEGGEVHFKKSNATPPIDVYLQHVNGVAHNLTNSRKVAKSLAASITAEGEAMHSGHFNLKMKIDPYAKQPTFDLAVSLKGLDLRELNAVFEHYLAVQVKDGVFGLYTETEARDGRFSGYVKPLVRKLDVVKLAPQEKSVGSTVKGVFVKVAAAIFKNRSENQIATKVKLSGRFDSPDVDVWSAISSFLENAFIHAIAPGFDNEVDDKMGVDVKGDKKDEKPEDKTDKKDDKQDAAADKKLAAPGLHKKEELRR